MGEKMVSSIGFKVIGDECIIYWFCRMLPYNHVKAFDFNWLMADILLCL